MAAMIVELLLFLQLLTMTASQPRSAIKLVNNGYETVVVAIHRTVTEDPRIVQEIKNMFIDASEYLYRATRQRAYFRSVTILIPDTWNDSAAYNASADERFMKSDIRVSSPNTQFGDDPYTKQPGRCGQPGHYIHLTPRFILDPLGKRFYTYGNAGRLLVHEFAHLRWGVFDEYGYKGNKLFPMFYTTKSGTVRPNGCPNNLKGVLLNRKTRQLCEIDKRTSLPTDSCRFFANSITNQVTASVMNMQHLEQVARFCESDGSDVSIRHNAEAPNKHNKMCSNRGTWDVILEHQDFTNGSNPSNPGLENTKPDFKLVYPRSRDKIVLVLDISGSMSMLRGKPVQRFYQLKQAFSKFIQDCVPTGTEVGVVTFNYRANPNTPLVTISNQTTRDRLANALDRSSVGGSTAIALGIEKAMEMLGAGDLTGSKLLVMTDGAELVSPFKLSLKNQDFLRRVTSSGVVIDALGFGLEASEKVESLATTTGGQVFYYSESLQSTALDRALAKTVQEFGNVPNEVACYTAQFTNASNVHEGIVNIDAFLGKDTKFIISCPEGSKFNVTLTSPSGKSYRYADKEYEHDELRNVIRITLPHAEVGNWTYRISTTDDLGKDVKNVIVNVKSFPPDDVIPIEVQAWVNKAEIIYTDDHIILYVDISQGQAPVINATVKAIVDRPQGGVVSLSLKDNGCGADSQEDDGVYSIYFTGIVSNGRYSVDVVVDNSDNAAATLFNGGGNSGAFVIWQNDTADAQPLGLPYFTRTTIAGAFTVRSYTNSTDPYPPSRITDLIIVRYSHLNQSVTLSFTAPGDDLDNGRAKTYHVRVAESFEEISASFSTAFEFNTDHVVDGSLLPDDSGALETITLKFHKPVNNAVLYFAVATTDSRGNMADASNVVSVAIRYQGEDDIGLDVDKWAPIIAALCGVFTVLLLLMIVGITYYKHKQELNKVATPRDIDLAVDTRI